jgi:hypothetical protein
MSAPAAGALMLLACADNGGVLAEGWHFRQYVGVKLTPPQREVLEWIDDRGLRGVLLASNANLCYLAATYTALRPWYGHPYNTPDLPARRGRVRRWKSGELRGEWSPPVDYALVPATGEVPPPDAGPWCTLFENSELKLLGRCP